MVSKVDLEDTPARFVIQISIPLEMRDDVEREREREAVGRTWAGFNGEGKGREPSRVGVGIDCNNSSSYL